MQKNPDSVNESPTIKENDKPSSEGIGMDSNKQQETKYDMPNMYTESEFKKRLIFLGFRTQTGTMDPKSHAVL